MAAARYNDRPIQVFRVLQRRLNLFVGMPTSPHADRLRSTAWSQSDPTCGDFYYLLNCIETGKKKQLHDPCTARRRSQQHSIEFPWPASANNRGPTPAEKLIIPLGLRRTGVRGLSCRAAAMASGAHSECGGRYVRKCFTGGSTKLKCQFRPSATSTSSVQASSGEHETDLRGSEWPSLPLHDHK